jgi:hypothetical protein
MGNETILHQLYRFLSRLTIIKNPIHFQVKCNFKVSLKKSLCYNDIDTKTDFVCQLRMIKDQKPFEFSLFKIS